MRVLVLGGTGFLGSNLVRALLDQGDEVRALIRPGNPAPTLTGLPLERVYGDLKDAESLARACHGVRIVYHTAGYYPSATIPVDTAVQHGLTQTRNVLNAVKMSGVDRMVFTSTLTTIGFPKEPGTLATEDCRFVSRFPKNPYLMSKAAMEEAVLEAAKDGVPVVVVNPTACYGPYDSRPTSGAQIVMIAKRLMPAYVQAPVNAIDVRDVADGMIRAATRGRIGERYILGNWNTTQKELGELMARVAGVRAPKIPVPFAVARYGSKVGDWAFRTLLRRPAPVPGFFVEMQQHMQQYDCSKAIRELDYPRHPVESAIRDALVWFRSTGYL
ncbi:MAG: NAD-dependent epimerase/dehydratase family protein [Nitrospirota bacterium]|nr:NAD-dependent epimerase/dehydratase family protein [Nitrospirota bacterium]